MNYFIFPIQLFYNINLDDEIKNIYLIEEPRFFTDFRFHKLKLVYHRASMKKYYDYLKTKYKNKNIKYINYYDVDNFYKKIKDIIFIDPII